MTRRARRGDWNGSGRQATRTARRLTGELLERRDCPAALLSMTIAQATVIEGESVVCTLRLSEPLQAAERVFVTTADGTATYGTDYFAPLSQQVVFAPGQTLRTITISTLRDAGRQVTEGNETFSITARPTTAALGSVTLGATIADYVPPPTISVADVSVVEGRSGTTTAAFAVTLSTVYPRAVTVAYATRDGSATVAGNDYVAATGTLTFAAGETSKTVNVSVNGDTVLETVETFQLVLSNPTESRIGRGTATATITDDEPDAQGFQITVTYDNPSLPTAQRDVFERAIRRLEEVIVGDLPGVALPNGSYVDDIEIRAYVESMDPNLNGYARPLASRPGATGLPYSGEIHINTARIGDPGIYYTVIHEMLHAMGFASTYFVSAGVASGIGTAQPLFTGINAVREFNSYFGTTAAGVPLYGVIAQQGSYGSHWDTNTIGTEIMSVGWDTTRTDVRPFSKITIGALQDMGYQVNYAAADMYVPQADQLAAARGVAASIGMGAGTGSPSSGTRETAQPSTGSRPSSPTTTAPRVTLTQPPTTTPTNGYRLINPPRTTTGTTRPVSRPVSRPLTVQRPRI